MLMPFTWIVLLSPALWVELSIDKSVFPKGADNWDRIGLFKLKDGDKDRLVLLYYHDSDSVAEKIMKKKGFTFRSYPNSFAVHAICQAKPGKWVHTEVFGVWRVRFTSVATVASDHLLLECQGNFMVSIEPGEDIGKAVKRAEEINKHFMKRVSFVDGVLSAKDEPDAEVQGGGKPKK